MIDLRLGDCRFIGIEREPEFYELSQRRIAAAQVYGRQPGLFDG